MLMRGLLQVRSQVALNLRRNLGISAVVTQKAAALDPIQQLFASKVREYADKSKAAGGKMVGVSAETEKSLADQLERIDRIYAAKGVDMTSFPSFSFSDPTLEPVSVPFEFKDEAADTAGAAAEAGEVEHKPFYDL